MGSEQIETVTECATCGQPCDIGSGDGGTTCFYLPKGGLAESGEGACVTCGGKISNGFKPPELPPEMKP